jgi:hypothetical protein
MIRKKEIHIPSQAVFVERERKDQSVLFCLFIFGLLSKSARRVAYGARLVGKRLRIAQAHTHPRFHAQAFSIGLEKFAKRKRSLREMLRIFAQTGCDQAHTPLGKNAMVLLPTFAFSGSCLSPLYAWLTCA